MSTEDERAKHADYMRDYYHRNKERIRENERASRAAHPERRRAYQRKYRKAHPEQDRAWKTAHPEVRRAWETANRERLAIQRVVRQYGLDPVIVQSAFSPNALCALCGQPETVERLGHLSVDHDHETGQFRGFVCLSCNIALGYYERGVEPTKFHRLGITEVVDAYLGCATPDEAIACKKRKAELWIASGQAAKRQRIATEASHARWL